LNMRDSRAQQELTLHPSWATLYTLPTFLARQGKRSQGPGRYFAVAAIRDRSSFRAIW
jgi:hypothetical protein